MKKQVNGNKKLGMGLSALLGEGNKTSAEAAIENITHNRDDVVQLIPVNKIIAGVYQPRKHFDQDALLELSESIKENNVIQPIIVRKADEDRTIYEIIAGERRFRAAKMAGLSEVPAIIKKVSNIQALEFAIVENVQREDLSAIEEANSYKQLMNEFDYTQEQVSQKIGCSRSRVANALRLLTLPQEVQNMIDEGLISSGHGRVIVNQEGALEMANKIVKESLSVREVEELIGSRKQQKKPAKKKLDKIKITAEDLEKKNLKNQYLRAVEDNLSSVIGEGFKVKASYDTNKQKGKITLSYNNLDQIEELIKKLTT